MMNFLRFVLVAFIIFMALHAVGWAAEYYEEQHFYVSIHACMANGRCEHFRRPVDADNSVACMMSVGMQSAMQWGMEHPEWKVREWHCAKPGEADL